MANEVIIQKRKRSANWDDTEKNLLRECLKDVLHIIENKCTDTNMNKSKSLTWQKVMKSFNEINGRERNLNELKQQWRTMKMDAKKCNSDYKKSLRATGGGMKPPSPDPQTVEIMDMLPQEFDEDVNKFDSDSITRESALSCVLMPAGIEPIEKEVIIEIKDQNTPIIGSCPDNELPQESTPVPLKEFNRISLESLQSSRRKKRKFENEIVPESKSTVNRNTTVINLLQAEHDLKIKHMTEAHAWVYEEHQLKCENLKLQNLLLQKQLSQ